MNSPDDANSLTNASAPTTTVACRMLAAANAAYYIDGAGTFTPPTNNSIYDSVGWTAAPTPVVGKSGVDSQDLNACLVGTSTDGVVVAFRGTLSAIEPPDFEEMMDWLQDFLIEPYSDSTVQSWGTGIEVHAGWWDAVLSIAPSLDAQLAKLDPAAGNFYFTGHSKGGPMATLAAMRYCFLNPNAAKPVVYTFASPRPGNTAFATAFQNKGITQNRYENYQDIAPLFPPSASDVTSSLLPALELAQYAKKIDAIWASVLKALFNTVAGWDYASVGTGYFIPQNGSPIGQTNSQTQWSDVFVALMKGDYAAVPQAHCAACPSAKCQGGYMTGLCPSGICSGTS
jgi:hypothetical protein